MSQTLDLMDALIAHLKTRFDAVAVDYYPEAPENFRLNQAEGALLLNYGTSNYGEHEDVFEVVQSRELSFTLTIVARQLHGREGAVALLDTAKDALQGLHLEQTTKAISLTRDYFTAHNSGLWYYGLDFTTQSLQIQSSAN